MLGNDDAIDGDNAASLDEVRANWLLVTTAESCIPKSTAACALIDSYTLGIMSWPTASCIMLFLHIICPVGG